MMQLFPYRRPGRKPKNYDPFNPNACNSYYLSIKRAVNGYVNIPEKDKVETPNFHEFNMVVQTREQLIHTVKSTAARIGFKAIIPFSDRNNRHTATSYFCCSLSGSSVRKVATNCPFKLTYTKSVTDPLYRLQNDFRSFHNHPLPVQSELGPKRRREEDKEE